MKGFLAVLLLVAAVSATNKKDDFVVIGGGISGCMVANRLATYGYGVTLLEQGIDEGQVLSDFPSSVQMRYTDVSLLDAPFGLSFKTPRNQLLVNRILSFGLGWGLGGGSLVNGAITQRPFRTDYDKWIQNDPEMAGWGYDSMLNYHINMESNSQFNYATPQLNQQSLPLGGFGPLPIKDEIDFDPNINSGYSEDPNNANLYASHMANLLSATLGIPHLGHGISYAENPIGVGYSQKVAVGGYRVSAAHALIHPLIDPSLAGITYNPLLTVLTGAVAMRFDIDADNDELGEIKRLYYTYQGEELSIQAKEEYVLALGAINSPKLLLLSGVGPRADLEALGIEVVIDEPGVGLGLQDHPVVPAVIESQSTTFPNMKVDAQNLGLDSQALWFGQSAGYMATTGTPMHAFWKSSPDKEFIDTQVLLFDGSPFLSYPINNVLITPCVDVDSPSRGKVSLRSANHNHHAVVDYGFYFDPSVDAAVQADPSYLPRGSLVHIDCLLAVHSAVQTSDKGFYVYAPILDENLWGLMKGIRSGFVPDPTNLLGTVMGGIVRTMVLPGYHPASTLQMGGSANPFAPVDPQMRFKSIYNLRVVDASVQPTLVSSNPMLSIYAIAMKSADLMMKRQNLKPKLNQIDVFPMCNGWFVVSNGAGEDDNMKRDAAGTWFLTSSEVEEDEEPQPENSFDQGSFFVERTKTIWIKTPVGSESRALYLRFEKEEASTKKYEVEWDEDDDFLGPFFQRIQPDCVDGI